VCLVQADTAHRIVLHCGVEPLYNRYRKRGEYLEGAPFSVRLFNASILVIRHFFSRALLTSRRKAAVPKTRGLRWCFETPGREAALTPSLRSVPVVAEASHHPHSCNPGLPDAVVRFATVPSVLSR
jgi:hypothetical protein